MNTYNLNNYFQIVLVSLLFVFFASFLIHPLFAINQDLGRYFKVSEVILETKSVPKINLFSYTNSDFSFINTHWLGGMIFFLSSKIIGLKGLIIFKAMIILLAFGIVLRLAFKLAGLQAKHNFWLVFLSALLAIGILIERTDVRPEIFSFLLFSLYLYILYDSKSWKIWLLPILQVFWVNTHVYFFLGPALFIFFFVGRMFQGEKRELKRLLFVGLLIGFACFINPNGITGAFYPLTAMGDYGYTIVENQTPFFLLKFSYHRGIIALFFLAMAFLLFGFLLNFKRIKIFELLTAFFLCFLGIFAVRNFPIFALGMVPIMAINYSRPWFSFKKFFNDNFDKNEISIFKGFVFFLIILLLFIGIYVNKDKLSLATEPRAKKAVDFLVENKISGKMFNNFDVGGYLIYRLYPENKVFVDNRPEAYPVSFLQDIYIPMQENKELWDKYSQEYGFDFIFFEHTDITPWAQKFLKIISNDKNWEMVYSDNSEVIFIKKL